MKEKIVKVPAELYDDILDSIYTMMFYADDGIVSRGNPDYQEYFESIDKAKEVLEKGRDYINRG